MKIAVIGNYGAGNAGDELILEGLLKTLKSVSPGVQLLVLSGNPDETSKRYAVPSVPKFPAGIRSFFGSLTSGKTTEEVKSCNYVVLGGGGLFASVTFRANLLWAIQAYMAYKLGKPVIMYGQSLGEIKGFFLKSIIKYLFKKAIFVAVRDKESKTELEKLNLVQEIHLMPDLAFKLDINQSSIRDEKKALVCLRQLSNLSADFKSEIEKFLNWLTIEQKLTLTFVDFQKGTDDDGPLHNEIINSLKDKSCAKHISQLADSNALFTEFLNAGFIFGMRLHSVIAAIRSSTHFIAISYSPKVRNLLANYGLEKYCIDLSELDFEKLKSLYADVINNKESIKKSLDELNQNFKKDFEQVELKLKEKLV